MPSDAGMPLCESNPLWVEVQALTRERDQLRAENTQLREQVVSLTGSMDRMAALLQGKLG